MSPRRRVVVTGLGLVSPLGNTVDDSWRALLAGRSGAGPITRFDADGHTTTFACEVRDFEPSDYVDRKDARRMDRCSQLAIAAARQAEADSGLELAAAGQRAGAAVATAIGGLSSLEDAVLQLQDRGPTRVSPFAVVQMVPNLPAGWISILLGTRGPLLTESTACAASNMALGDGLDQIRLGRADVMICGGTEAPVTPVGLAGYGSSSDAHHVSDPDPTGTNPARALELAFADAGVRPDEIGYVNAHGTSTPAGDAAETRVLKRALGEEAARRTPISSTKGATGHPLGAAGAVEAVFTVLALQRGVLPPTINLEQPDPECDLDYIPGEARQQQVELAISNGFGFGGHNTCLVFRRWRD